FSPDGRWIVYRAVGADEIRGITYAENTGVFVASPDGRGEPRQVTDSRPAPMLDHTRERIYLRVHRHGREVPTSLALNSADEIVHFQSENATDIVPSPDGKWIAFAERYRAYIAAFPRTGRTVELGPRVSGYPVARISRDAGMYLHWSGDGTRVHWALGPEY